MTRHVAYKDQLHFVIAHALRTIPYSKRMYYYIILLNRRELKDFWTSSTKSSIKQIMYSNETISELNKKTIPEPVVHILQKCINDYYWNYFVHHQHKYNSKYNYFLESIFTTHSLNVEGIQFSDWYSNQGPIR